MSIKFLCYIFLLSKSHNATTEKHFANLFLFIHVFEIEPDLNLPSYNFGCYTNVTLEFNKVTIHILNSLKLYIVLVSHTNDWAWRWAAGTFSLILQIHFLECNEKQPSLYSSYLFFIFYFFIKSSNEGLCMACVYV